MVCDKMVSQTATRRRKTSQEVIFLRYRTELVAIDKAHHAAVYGNRQNGNINQMPQITDLLMHNPHRHVKHAAADALYDLLNHSNSGIAERAEKEFIKAMTNGDEYTKGVAIKYIRRTLMTDTRSMELKDETKKEIEGARSRAANVVKMLFEDEDCTTQPMIDSLILKGTRSGIPSVTAISQEILTSHIGENGIVTAVKKKLQNLVSVAVSHNLITPDMIGEKEK